MTKKSIVNNAVFSIRITESESRDSDSVILIENTALLTIDFLVIAPGVTE